MGFSIVGVVLAVAILLPNLLIILLPPKNVPADYKDAGLLFTVLERIGQAGCVAVLMLSKSNFDGRLLDVRFLLMLLFIALYYAMWLRYLRKGRDFKFLWTPLWMIPVPMAVFPILAFAFAALWGRSVWLCAAVIFLAAGHLVNSWYIYKTYR